MKDAISTLGKKCQTGFWRVGTANEYVDSAGFIASLLFKAFGSDSGIINQSALIAYDRYLFLVSRLMDTVLKRLFGKNVLLIARRP